jgi:hypothetical protein
MEVKYDYKITLSVALSLAREYGHIVATNGICAKSLKDWVGSIQNLYKNNGGYFQISRADYAEYVQLNEPLPEGYGYASFPLDSGRYEGLPYAFNHNTWVFGSKYTTNGENRNLGEWYEYAFKLEDLACVEQKQGSNILT